MSLLDDVSIMVTPNGVKANVLYSVIPAAGTADMAFTRATTATRVNSSGTVASVATGVPRLDYRVGQGCPHILVESARTNTLTYSQDIDNSDWVKSNVTVVANSTTSPDGTTNAEKVTKDGNSANDRISQVVAGGVTSSTKYSVSAFVKNNDNATGAKTTLAVKITSATLFRLTFEWTGSNLAISTGSNSGTRTNEFCEDYGNGWFRIGFTYEADGTAATYRLDVDRENGTATTGIFVWGCQHEEGGNKTSYIPTSSSSVTRNTEIFTKTSIGSLIGTSGVLYLELASAGSGVQESIALSDGSSSNRVLFFITAGGNPSAQLRIGGTILGTITKTGLTETDFNKFAIKYQNNKLDFFVNGSPLTPVTGTWTVPAFDRLGFDNGGSSTTSDFEGKIRNIQVYKTALTDDQCEELTT